ncbi:Dihydrofolate reductase-like domain containing protein [Naviculisporaceae sp. PSN 640]
MPPSPLPPLELTLVLAATRDMGIGLNGGLPWTGLKKEMAYFARVTKRVPPSSSSLLSSPATQEPPSAAGVVVKNAVIMGRKTWESIPPRFRPLKGRVNVVISRSVQETTSEEDKSDEVIMAPSLEQALSYLGERREHDINNSKTAATTIGKVFVIGGGQIYGAALKLPQTKRILLTRVLSDFECDTFFPLVLGGTENGGIDGEGWKRSSQETFNHWVGEDVPEGIQEENGTQYEFQMWER